jgi:hypothetical protein
MGTQNADEHGRDGAVADAIDMVGEDENPAGIPQINPLKGLLDPDVGTNSPAGDTDAPVPPG